MDTINEGKETIKEAVSILSRLRNGKPLYEIAAEERISIGEASSRLNDELVQEKKNTNEELHNKIIALCEKGVPAEEIAKEFDIPFSKMKNIIVNSSFYKNDAIRFYQKQKEQFNEENPDVASTLSLKEREERNNAVAEAFAKGKSIKEIAQQFYLKPGMVYFILRNKGIPVQKTGLRINKGRNAPNRRYDDELVQRVIETYRELKNIRKTAEKLHIYYFATYKILRKNNMLQTKICRKELPLMKKAEVTNEILKAHSEKMTISEISARVGISYNTIRKFLVSNNLIAYRTSTINSENKKKYPDSLPAGKSESAGKNAFKKRNPER